MRPISVLFTNNTLAQRAGSEAYVCDVARALLRRGHRPAAFSLALGQTAQTLRRATVPVVDDLTRLAAPPDVIHGHHHLETLIAALSFPETPIVNFCHGWVPWEEIPLHHPAVRRYVAVDEVCVDRLVREEGIAQDRVELLLNFVDLARFQPRSTLPPRPQRALILSNSATADGYTRAIRSACDSAGIVLDIVGAAAGNSTEAPETLLRGYDIVFSKGRTALEALAVGCATVVADAAGAGPLVAPDNYEVLRVRNFGIRELSRPHDVSWYGAQIAQYCAARSAEVSARVRVEAGMEPAIDRLLTIYATAIAAPPGSGVATRAVATHLCRHIAQPLKHAHELSSRLQTTTRNLEAARRDLDSCAHAGAGHAARAEFLESRIEVLTRDVEAARADLEARAAEMREASAGVQSYELAAQDQILALQRQVAAYQALPTLRLRDALLRTPVVGLLLQSSARRLARMLRPSD